MNGKSSTSHPKRGRHPRRILPSRRGLPSGRGLPSKRGLDIRRILVAVKDPWNRSLPAVVKSLQHARAFGAHLQIFHAMSDPVYIDVAAVHGQDLAKLESERRTRTLARLGLIAERLARRRSERLAQDGGPQVSVAAEWDFPPHEAVIRAARALDADLIVAERHPSSHHLPWLLRFTDFELLRRSPVPVLLVKTSKPYARPRILAAIDPGHTFAKPQSLDTEILRCGSAVARALGGELHAIHAYDPLPAGALSGEVLSGEWLAELERTTEKGIRATLEGALRGAAIPLARRHLIARHPVDAIEQVAAAIRSDIVVMGAISRSGLKRLVLGNTAERLLDHLPCDVLVVKPRQFASRIPRARRGAQLIALSVLQPGI